MSDRKSGVVRLKSSVEFGHDYDYFNVVDGQFVALAMREGALRFRGLSWPTDVTEVDALGDVLCAASYNHNGARCVLARVFGVIGMLVLEHSRFVARLAAATEEELDEAERRLRDGVPRSEPDPVRQEVSIGFWCADRQHSGGAVVYSRLAVPSWEEIAGNYPAGTRDGLELMARSFRPGHGGRLLLWTGAPGTGKTYALRALAWEWRSWCSVHYIADPDAMFGSHGEYLMQVVMRHGRPGQWRLLVLEDTGELLAADAKSRTGQGLSRLLNVVDGLIGQGFPTLVLVTTNDELSSLHPAVARPGRCASRIEFAALTELDSNEWLTRRGVEDEVRGQFTIAELYALADGRSVSSSSRPSVGFVR